jgi:nitrite reductase/ring-hydroxylating ferredoxin subunit
MNRRRTVWFLLLGLILAAVVGMLSTSVLGAAWQPDRKIAVAIAGLPDMTSVPVRPGMPALAARTGYKGPTRILLSRVGDTWHAFSNRSTHQGEELFPHPETGVFMDPVVGTVYDRQGRNIAGPAPRPLDWYPVSVEGDNLIIDLARPQLGGR